MPFHIPDVVKLSISALNPVAYNPRSITPEKFAALKTSIITEGFIEPIVVQKNGFNIIGGHQRVNAVKEICVEAGEAPPKLPCIVLDIDDAHAKKLNIKLNHLKGDFVPRMLGELLVDIFDGPTLVVEEVNMLGFSEDEAKQYMRIVDPNVTLDNDDAPTSFGKNPTISVQFPTARLRDQVKKILVERAELEKKTSGEILADALGIRKATAKVRPKKRRAA